MSLLLSSFGELRERFVRLLSLRLFALVCLFLASDAIVGSNVNFFNLLLLQWWGPVPATNGEFVKPLIALGINSLRLFHSDILSEVANP